MKRYILFTIMAFLLVGCASGNNANQASNDEPNNNQHTNDDASDVEVAEEIVEANNTFAFRFLKETMKQQEEPLFLSPYSVFMALAMTLNGADAETREEMQELLAVEDFSIEEMNEWNEEFRKVLEKADKMEFATANALWLNKDYQFNQKFEQDVTNFYDAEVKELDFRDDKSAKVVNDWVKEQTNDKITEMVEPPLDPSLVTMLMNAVYFKADWENAFSEELTENADFTGVNKTTEVDLMSEEREWTYAEKDGAQLVQLPYTDGMMSMYAILPAEDTDLMTLAETLTADRWQEWKQELTEMEGIVKLPKFEMDYDIELTDVLESLGMKSAFDPEIAQFPSMIKDSETLWIDFVRHKTYIDVNEEGTEAAAVTNVGVKEMSAVETETFYFEATRPFLFLIVDEETDAIIFTGAMTDL